MDENILKLLACPKCRNPLALASAGLGLVCAPCAKVYPIIDEIPHLLVEEGIPLARWEEDHAKQEPVRES